MDTAIKRAVAGAWSVNMFTILLLEGVGVCGYMA